MDIMGIYELIRDCKTDEDLEKLAQAAIKVATEEAMEANKNFGIIGPDIDINKLQYEISESGIDVKRYYTAVNAWNGYLPRGIKIVYGGQYDDHFKSYTNGGHYYYLDDESYILKFYKYIRELKIENEYDIILAAHYFMRELFKSDYVLSAKDRREINKAIYQPNGLLFSPIKEHSIKDFYGNGSAECTEYSSIGVNLLSSVGFNALYLQDKGHAYNIVVYGNLNKIFIVDFANWVEYYDKDFHIVDTLPFYREIEGATVEDLDKMANEGKRIEMKDYYYCEIGGKPFEIVSKKTRDYGIDYSNVEDKPTIIKKIKHI